MKKLLLSVFIGTIISLCLVGCGQDHEHPSGEGDHPEGEHSTKADHPESEHPE